MLIEAISIKNFRQFHGNVTLDFSIDSEKNITVVHGSNGSGKTSFLNAFKWCFYGETDFDTADDHILNDAAIQEQKDGGLVEIIIEVVFSNEGKRYCARRTQKYKKSKGLIANKIDDSLFTLDITGDDGQTIRSSQPNIELNSIIPPDLHPYFFFNGERIEHIAGINQSVQVQDAIRKLMGLEMVERAILHVGKAKNSYRKLLRKEVSEDEQYLHDEIESIEAKISSYDENQTKSKRDEELAKSAIQQIERKLKKFEKSRDLQEKRDLMEDHLKSNRAAINEVKESQKRLINENGFFVLSGKMFKECSELVEYNRKKGILPYGIKEQFIDDRIELGSCICGTDIKANSKEHNCLLEVRKSAGSNALESAYTSVAGLLKNYRDDTANYKAASTHAANQLHELNLEDSRLRAQLSDISAELSKPDDRVIADLEKDHKAEVLRRDRAITDKGLAEHGKITERVELDKSKLKLSRLEKDKSHQLIANLRMVKAEEIGEVLVKLRDSLANQVRADLSARVDKTFQSIIRKPVRAIIDNDYKLQVLKKTNDGEEHIVNEQSTGERQVTSLSFIASIIALAKEKHEKGKNQFFQGGLYPLVMDSPFGSLDDDYREKVAAGVSLLAEQVVIFVSNSQWSGRVKQACEGKVGKSYKLIYHSPKVPESENNEYVVQSDNGFEYSTVEEVIQ